MKCQTIFPAIRHLVKLGVVVVFLSSGGLSNPWSIEPSREIRETEPNNTLAQAQSVSIPSLVIGTVDGIDAGQFELYGFCTTSDLYRFNLVEPAIIRVGLEYGHHAGLGAPGFLCGKAPTTCVDGNPDLFLLGLSPLRLIDFSAHGFLNFGDQFFPGDPFDDESIPSPAADLFGFPSPQPLAPGEYVVAVTDEARAILSLLTDNHSVGPFEPTVYRLRITALGPNGQAMKMPPWDAPSSMPRTAAQGDAMKFEPVTDSQLQAIERVLGTAISRQNVRKLAVAQDRMMQIDYFENTAKAPAVYLLNQRRANIGIVTQASPVSDQYLKVGPMALKAGTYYLVAVTSKDSIYSLSITDGLNPRPILGAFQFPEIHVNQEAALRYWPLSLR